MVGTVNMLLMRWVSTSRHTSSASKPGAVGSTVRAPRATLGGRCAPAPCDRGATTSDASSAVSPGIRSASMLAAT